ncbi:MAG: outer membrane protein assembly factor BamE [Neisseria sp.]|nr:outer membrane protein assembly factor BamE [Neisseria sp.]
MMPLFLILLFLPLLPAAAHGAGTEGGSRRFEVVQSRPQYRVNYPLQWRKVDDPSLGQTPDWAKINQIREGTAMAQVRDLLGEAWHTGNSFVVEWNYLYRYPFRGQMQQCQYKIVFDKDTGLVKGVFWEAVGDAFCRT